MDTIITIQIDLPEESTYLSRQVTVPVSWFSQTSEFSLWELLEITKIYR